MARYHGSTSLEFVARKCLRIEISVPFSIRFHKVYQQFFFCFCLSFLAPVPYAWRAMRALFSEVEQFAGLFFLPLPRAPLFKQVDPASVSFSKHASTSMLVAPRPPLLPLNSCSASGLFLFSLLHVYIGSFSRLVWRSLFRLPVEFLSPLLPHDILEEALVVRQISMPPSWSAAPPPLGFLVARTFFFPLMTSATSPIPLFFSDFIRAGFPALTSGVFS